MVRAALSLAALVAVAACSRPLPEPESPGARLYAARCGGCHGVYQPGTMTVAMWDVQLDRMHRLFAQRGLPWFPPDEERMVREYLARHAGTS